MDGAAGRSRSNGRGDQGGAAAGHQIHRARARDREGFEGTAQGEAAFGLRRQATRQARQADEGRGERAEGTARHVERSEEHTSELQSLMRISYAVFCLKENITMKKMYKR